MKAELLKSYINDAHGEGYDTIELPIEDARSILDELVRLREERDSFQRVGIRAQEKLVMAAKELEWVYEREGWVRIRNVLDEIQK